MIVHSIVTEVGSIGCRVVFKRQISMNYITLIVFELETEILNLKVCCHDFGIYNKYC
jgi:hypothetical protein